jgi:RNA polymerase sigma-70 factor (ECF subfamily)
MLEQLQPLERAVFLMREVFEFDYAEIAAIQDKSEAACHQSFSRARKHLAAHRQSERDRDATGFRQPGGSAFLLQ